MAAREFNQAEKIMQIQAYAYAMGQEMLVDGDKGGTTDAGLENLGLDPNESVDSLYEKVREMAQIQNGRANDFIERAVRECGQGLPGWGSDMGKAMQGLLNMRGADLAMDGKIGRLSLAAYDDDFKARLPGIYEEQAQRRAENRAEWEQWKEDREQRQLQERQAQERAQQRAETQDNKRGTQFDVTYQFTDKSGKPHFSVTRVPPGEDRPSALRLFETEQPESGSLPQMGEVESGGEKGILARIFGGTDEAHVAAHEAAAAPEPAEPAAPEQGWPDPDKGPVVSA